MSKQKNPLQGRSCPKRIMDKNTLFSSIGKVLMLICTIPFIDRVSGTGQDKYFKKPRTLAYFKFFHHAQKIGRDGLRDIAEEIVYE